MTAPLLIVGLLIVAALVVAFGAPVARRRRTLIVGHARPVRRVVRTRVTHSDVVRNDVVPSPVGPVPVVEEIVEDRYSGA
jgi:hypothetical protein